jgi:hypothetical protein
MTAHYGMVGQVRIEHVDDSTVTFTTRSASQSGDPDECLPRMFTCARTEVSTQLFEGAPAPVALVSGAVGPLFLTAVGWETRSDDGFHIYGHGTPLARIKFPDSGGLLEFVGDLMIIPSSIVVHGTLKGGREFVDLELLGPDTTQAQHIAWSGADCVVVRLTSRGARHLHLQEHTKLIELWPTRITVTGAPVSDPAVSGSVDLLHNERAGLAQDFAFATHGEPIRLSLTHDGFAAFHVVPGMPDPDPTSRRRRLTHRH